MDKELEMPMAEETVSEEAVETVAEEIADEKLETEVEELSADEEPVQPEKKGGKGWIFGLLAAVIALAIIFFVAVPMFKGESETPAVNNDEVVLKVGETEFTLEEFNYMYVTSFNEIYSNLYSYYGSNISSLVDMSKPLEDQVVYEGTTWHDYVIEYTLESIENRVYVYEAAIEAGFELSAEDRAEVDALEENIIATAEEDGLSMQEYLDLLYGEGMSIETVKKMTEITYVAGAYAMEYENGITVAEEDITAYYEANKNTIDTVDFRYYSVYYGEGGDHTEAEAKEIADLIAATKTGEEFNSVVVEYVTEEQKEYFAEGSDPTIWKNSEYSSTGIEEVAEWLYDEARVQGDTMVYPDEEYTSYLVIMFEGRTNPDYNLVNVRHILIMPEEAEDGTVSDEALAAAEAKASEVLAEYLGGEMTEDSFAALAVKNSADGNASTGGIYENVYKGQMVAEFEDWCFDETRETGDTGIVKTQFGYHVMYYVGEGESNLISLVEPTIAQQRMTDWIAELGMEYTTEKTEAFANITGIIDDIVNAAQAKAEKDAASEEAVG